jgi:hypothetical protein
VAAPVDNRLFVALTGRTSSPHPVYPPDMRPSPHRAPLSLADRFTELHTVCFRVNSDALYRFLLPRLSVDDMARVIRLYPSDLRFALRFLLTQEDPDAIITTIS